MRKNNLITSVTSEGTYPLCTFKHIDQSLCYSLLTFYKSNVFFCANNDDPDQSKQMHILIRVLIVPIWNKALLFATRLGYLEDRHVAIMICIDCIRLWIGNLVRLYGTEC